MLTAIGAFVALGLAAVFFPLRVRLSRGVLALVAATPVAGGLALIGGVTHRAAGVVLLLGFAASITYLARAARAPDFLGADAAEVVAEAPRRLATAFHSRGQVTRAQGVILLVLYAGYVTTHILVRA